MRIACCLVLKCGQKMLFLHHCQRSSYQQRVEADTSDYSAGHTSQSDSMVFCLSDRVVITYRELHAIPPPQPELLIISVFMETLQQMLKLHGIYFWLGVMNLL